MPMKPSIMTRVYWKCYEWPGRTFNFTLLQILKRVAKSGLSYVDFCEYPLEFWPMGITEKEVDLLVNRLAELNLKASGITVPTFSPGLEILPEEKDRQLIIDRLKKAIEIASRLKGETVMYGISPIPIYMSMDETYKWTLNLFHECLDTAEKYDVNIAVEFVNHYFKTSETIIDFLEEVGSENIGLCLEVGNTMARPPDETLMQHLKKCGEKVKLVHINDPINKEWLRSINVDLDETIKTLQDLGYKGFIVIESLNDSTPCSELDDEVARVM
ncbi:MAG: sugar phosphate isomerase/epimerase, partial [Candidatus Brockarchaeota archaeon]|nr:sugar phosphate isomerase/epimerase [Candidatus Brockarchaeota archaeon]